MTQRSGLIRETITVVVKESSPGTHPGSGDVRVKLENGSILPTGFTREMIPNDTESPSRYDNPEHIPGKKIAKWGPLSWRVRGIPEASRLVAAGSATALSDEHLYEHGYGRRYAAVGTTTSGTSSSTSNIDLTAVTGRKAGELLAIESTSGGYEFGQVSVVGASDVDLVTALASAPNANGRIVRAARNFVLPETRNSTLSISQKFIGPSVTDEEYRVTGAMGTMKITFPEVGKPILHALEGEAVDWFGPTTLADPSWGAGTDPSDGDMDAPLLWAPVLYINGTETRFEPGTFSLEIMQKPDPEGNGAKSSGFGSWLDTAGRDNGVAVSWKLRLRMDTAQHAVFDAKTIKSLMLVCSPGGSALTTAAVWLLPRTQLTGPRPVPVSLGSGRIGIELTGHALRNTLTPTTSSAQDTDLARSPIVFGLF
jgi:hypothetical protein